MGCGEEVEVKISSGSVPRSFNLTENNIFNSVRKINNEYFQSISTPFSSQ